jgi:soluble lytic murein transglycosylase
MRNESNFRPRVISPAGAVGLLQLMPTTAREAAGASGGKNFERRDLFVPAENIRFGTAYLKKLKGFFPDNPVAIVASYNAGEAAVMRWLSKGNMNDIEEWIEEIPYSETNLYVKRVLASYWNYKRLYRN